jgi:ABC-type polysaccharide/polyol phosphate export permease
MTDTAIDVRRSEGSGGDGHVKPVRAIADSWVIARRLIVHMRRQPEMLSDATIQPIMFVLLFAYVFGGAIAVPGGGDYKEFLMGGIFAQTIVFGAFGVALAVAHDRTNGAIDRFHSLPINRGAVLGGHAMASLVKSLLPILLMSLTGFVVGWTISSSLADALAGYALMVGFSFAMVWVGVLMGSLIKTPEGVTGFAFAALFPITFIASTFVPTSTLPEPLRTFAEWNPVSSLAGALRTLFGNPGGVAPPDSPWPLLHPVTYTAIWAVAIVLICAPLSIRAFQRSIAR